jgi:CheY-like chemotaxis protein
MVYGFIKQSGGAVRIYSELGVGTTISLYLPPATALIQPAAKPVVAEAYCKLGGTALVVDDEPALLEIAGACLNELGYNVIGAEDSVRALEVAGQDGAIDLLVTDIFMPGKMNGIELAQKVRELCPGIRVIFTSGFPAEALPERSGKLVDGPLLCKPYLQSEFAAMVRKTMSENLHYGRFEGSISPPG